MENFGVFDILFFVTFRLDLAIFDVKDGSGAKQNAYSWPQIRNWPNMNLSWAEFQDMG